MCCTTVKITLAGCEVDLAGDEFAGFDCILPEGAASSAFARTGFTAAAKNPKLGEIEMNTIAAISAMQLQHFVLIQNIPRFIISPYALS
jgi:hypothetical protein